MFFDDDEMLERAKRLKVSTNYHFCNSFLPGLFFYKPEMFAICLKHNEMIHKLLDLVLDVMKKEGFDIDEFKNLKCDFRTDKDKLIAGIMIEIPNPTIEPECNYICVCFKDRTPVYFESELYEDETYGLCSRNENGGHSNYGHLLETISSFDDMWKALLKVI